MFAYSIINFHELTPGSLCNVIANKFHFPIHQLADQVMTYFRSPPTISSRNTGVQHINYV
jgi:hypothetical protein